MPLSPEAETPNWVTFLKQELAPFPGRGEATAKLVIAVVVTLILSETLRVPNVAISVYLTFFIVKDNLGASLKFGLASMVGVTIALGLALLITVCFVDAPWFRLPVSIAVLALSLWLSFALVLGALARIMAVMLSLYLSLADYIESSETLIRSILWLWPVCGIGIAVAILVTALWPPSPQIELVNKPSPIPAPPKPGLWVSDAFTNKDYLLFALRTSAALATCELVINAVDWPGIRTAMITCVVTAMATSHARAQKQTLRLVGALLGGVLGLFSVIVLIPQIDSIFSLCLLVAGGTLIAAWVATGSERISYAGFQIGLAFYMTTVQGFAVATDLTVLRDRLAGILLGITMMWLFFNPPKLWGISSSSK